MAPSVSPPAGMFASSGTADSTHDTRKNSLSCTTKDGIASSSSFGSAHEHNLSVDDSEVVALDCEMVGVGVRCISVLARVSMVDGNGKVLLDTFVNVEERVTDYRTSVSGIRPQDLQQSARRLSYGECRTRVKNLLRGKILVGHGLTNDLTVLKLTHPWNMMRDTSQYPPFFNCWAKPRRLRDLVWQFLGQTIQTGEHDSKEDARAALALYVLVRKEWDAWIEALVAMEQQQHQYYYQQQQQQQLEYGMSNDFTPA